MSDTTRNVGDCFRPLTDWPVRILSANGQPKPTTSIERTCRRCRASFLGLAPGTTGKRGLWAGEGLAWWCSQECFNADHPNAVQTIEVEHEGCPYVSVLKIGENGWGCTKCGRGGNNDGDAQ